MNRTIPLMRSILFTIVCLLSIDFCVAANLPSNAELAKLGLQLHWHNQAVLNVQRDKVRHISNDEENIYVQSSAGVVTAFHAENGQKRWVTQVGRTDEAAMQAVSNSDMVIILAGPIAHALNKFDGSVIFSHRLPSQPSAAPAVSETEMFVPLVGGALYAYSLKILEYKTRYGSLPDTVPTAHAWRFLCNEEIIYPPVVGDLAVAFVTQDSNLHSVNATGIERGRSRFQLLLHKPASAAPAIAPNESSYSMIVPTADNQIFSVDIVRGSNEWTYPMGRTISDAPMIIQDKVLIITEDGTLTKISRDPNWGRPVEVPQYVSPAYIGASIEDAEIDADTQDALRLLTPSAVKVTEVFSDGAASAAGMLAGDRILSIDDRLIDSTAGAQTQLAEMPLRVERPVEILRVSMGAQLADRELSAPIYLSETQAVTQGVQIVDVVRNGPAFEAGLLPGDMIVAIDNAPVVSADTLRLKLVDAAPGKVTAKVMRGRKGIETEITLAFVADELGRPTEASAISIQKLRMRIPVRKWDVSGIASLTAVGRFGVYGIDVTNQLVAFDRTTAKLIGRIPVSGYRTHHHNSATDFIYLCSDSGEVVCLREIGTTVRVPELSVATRYATVKEVAVKQGDGVDLAGTLVCRLEAEDGSAHDVSIGVKGVVNSVLVRTGDIVEVGQALVQIAEDNFATYHQNPEKRPIDIIPASPNSVPASE